MTTLGLPAPVAGLVKAPIKVGAAVKSGDVLLRVEGKPAVKATFQAPAGKTFAVDRSIEIHSESSPDMKASCTVTEVKDSDVTVTCPTDGGLVSGTVVVLP
jgi:hypothetical protein